jgi:hypothetical protein
MRRGVGAAPIKGGTMGLVVMHNVVSVDGYIADDNDDVGPLFEWYFNGDHPLSAGEMDDPAPGGCGVSKASYHFVDDVTAAVAKAKQLAGEDTVAVAAGDVGGQALALGLVDEVSMDVVPVVFGYRGRSQLA